MAASEVTGRDEEFEYSWLRRAEEIAATKAGWVRRVLDRLQLGQALYGDAWRGRSIEDLVREAREEVEDAPAWSVLAVHLLREHPDIDDVDRAQMLRWLQEAAARCAEADELYRRVLLKLPEGA